MSFRQFVHSQVRQFCTLLVAPALTNLLAPHGVVEAFLLDERMVLTGFDDAPALEHVDTIGVHDRRQAVSDENGDGVALRSNGSDRVGYSFFGERVDRWCRLV